MVPIRGFVLLLRSSWTSWFPIFLLRIPMKMHEVNEVGLSVTTSKYGSNVCTRIYVDDVLFLQPVYSGMISWSCSGINCYQPRISAISKFDSTVFASELDVSSVAPVNNHPHHPSSSIFAFLSVHTGSTDRRTACREKAARQARGWRRYSCDERLMGDWLWQYIT